MSSSNQASHYICKCIRFCILCFSERSWKLLYSVQADSKQLDALLDEEIPMSTLNQSITLIASGSNKKYSDNFITFMNENYRYSSLFPLYFDERVSEGDYRKLENSLVAAWNSVLTQNRARSAKVLRQEEVITAEG